MFCLSQFLPAWMWQQETFSILSPVCCYCRHSLHRNSFVNRMCFETYTSCEFIYETPRTGEIQMRFWAVEADNFKMVPNCKRVEKMLHNLGEYHSDMSGLTKSDWPRGIVKPTALTSGFTTQWDIWNIPEPQERLAIKVSINTLLKQQ